MITSQLRFALATLLLFTVPIITEARDERYSVDYYGRSILLSNLSSQLRNFKKCLSSPFTYQFEQTLARVYKEYRKDRRKCRKAKTDSSENAQHCANFADALYKNVFEPAAVSLDSKISQCEQEADNLYSQIENRPLKPEGSIAVLYLGGKSEVQKFWRFFGKQAGVLKSDCEDEKKTYGKQLKCFFDGLPELYSKELHREWSRPYLEEIEQDYEKARKSVIWFQTPGRGF